MRPTRRPWRVTVEPFSWLGDEVWVATVERKGPHPNQVRVQAIDDTPEGALGIALAAARGARALQRERRKLLN